MADAAPHLNRSELRGSTVVAKGAVAFSARSYLAPWRGCTGAGCPWIGPTTNRLAQTASSYLLQHAGIPVGCSLWSPQAGCGRVAYTSRMITRLPQSLDQSSRSEVRTIAGAGTRSASAAMRASIAYLCPCSPPAS